MDGYTFRYLDLAALQGVSGILLADRPALIFSADGTRVLLANAAGAALLGDKHLATVLERRFSDLNPIRKQIARLARTLPTDNARLEMLNLGRGVQLETFTAACRRINLPGDERVVLATGMSGAPRSLTTRAEALVDMIGDSSRLAALMAEDGKVIAASGGFDTLMPAEPAVDALIDTALASGAPVIKQHLATSKRNAGTVRLTADGRTFVLLMIGPASVEEVAKPPARPSRVPFIIPGNAANDTRPEATVEVSVPRPENDEPADAATAPLEATLPVPVSAAEPIEPMAEPAEQNTLAPMLDDPADEAGPGETKAEQTSATEIGQTESQRAPRPIFTWAMNAERIFTFISGELKIAVGEKYASVEGLTWEQVSRTLSLDPDGTLATSFTRGKDFSARVFWPAHQTEDTVAIELTAMAAPDGSYRGFGTIIMDERRPDLREEKITLLADPGASDEEPELSTETPREEEAAEAPAVEDSDASPSSAASEALSPAPPQVDEGEPASDHQPLADIEPFPDETGEALETVPAGDVMNSETPDHIAEHEDNTPTRPPARPPLAMPIRLSGDENLDLAAQLSIESGAPPRRVAPANANDAIDQAPLTARGATATTIKDPAARIENEIASVSGASSNIVHLPQRTLEKLTGAEREAFRRIAEALGREEGASDDLPPPGYRLPTTDNDDGDTDAGASPIAAVTAPEIDTRILDRVPVGIAIFRGQQTLFANRALVEILGYENAASFIAAGGAETIFPHSGMPEEMGSASGRLAARRADGTSLPVSVWLHTITFAGATALMLSLTAERDTPPDSEDELVRALARSESRAEELEAILDTATDGVIVMDHRGRIESLNRSAEALFDVNSNEFEGRFFTDLLAEESQKEALDYLDGLISNGVASVLNDGREVIGRTPNGGLMPLFMTMGRIGSRTGSGSKFAAVLRDITHWKKVEAELIAARREAENASAQKSDFLAKISHEIRTPLNAIIGFSEVMMEERFGAIGNTRYRDYMRDIHTSGAHLMSLINDLLDLSKIEAGKLDLSFEAVTLNTVIQECVALMQPQASRQRIIIRTSLAANLPDVVADPRSIRQILLNLMSNAVKFTRAGGQVIVSTSLEDTGELIMRIRDTGIGMSERDIETALKPFQQVATSRSDQQQGTGLGLPLTKALVEANRAAFAIESAPDQGTLVRVTFPNTRVLAG